MVSRAQNKVIKEVLMCKPLHFSISYIINPWMKVGSEDKNLAKIQWQKLYQTYVDLGIKVNIVDQKSHVPDMVFATDQGIVRGKKVVMSNFRFKERRAERKPYSQWFKKNGFDLEYIPDRAHFEGNGECLFFGPLRREASQKLLIGIGFRASLETCKYLKKALKIEVVPLELINPFFYHLDTALFVLNKETVFYYPGAFSKKSKNILKKLVPNLIELSDFEANNFAANSVVTDHTVVLNKTLPQFRRQLEKLGYRTIEVDISEFAKAGGGAHCLTNILKEE